MIYINFVLIYFLIGFIIGMFLSDLDLHNIWLIIIIWPIYLIAFIISLIYYYFIENDEKIINKDCGCGN